jgi:hypothetical protein
MMIIERPPDSTALRANSLATRTACAADTPVTVLDHLRMAIAAAGWDTAVARFPDPTQRDHVAAVVRLDVVPDDARPQVADAFSAHREPTASRLHLSIRITLADIVFRA